MAARRHLPAKVTLAGFVLLALAIAQVMWPSTPPSNHDIPTTALLPAQPAIPPQDWAAILARPLFSPDRKTTHATMDDGPFPLDGWVVLGIGVTDATGTALIKGSSGKASRIIQGQQIDGWTLTRIDPNRLIFTRNNLSKVLPFDPKPLRPRPETQLRPKAAKQP